MPEVAASMCVSEEGCRCRQRTGAYLDGAECLDDGLRVSKASRLDDNVVKFVAPLHLQAIDKQFQQ